MTRRPTGHVRERSSGKFELRYQAPDEATGANRLRTTSFAGTRREAERELRRILRSVDENDHVDPTKLTVEAWLKEWLQLIRSDVSPKTWERYDEIVRHHLIPALGAVRLPQLRERTIQTAYSALESAPRRDGRPGALSARSRLHIHRVLRGALERAVTLRIIGRNPSDGVNAPKVQRTEIKTLALAEVTALLAGVRHTRVFIPAFLALSTGMRRGELLALRWGNLDLDRAVVRVVESLESVKGSALRFKAPKSGKSRVVDLPAYAVVELRRWKLRQAEELLALGVRQTKTTLVCPRHDGEPMEPNSLTHEFRRMVARLSDVPRVRFHDLRHSHATLMLQNGVHPKVMSERLGHSTIAITLDIYAHVTPSLQAEAVTRLDAMLGHVVGNRRSD